MESSLWMPTRPWSLPFLADAEQVSSLRRALRTHLEYWGLHELRDAAELCVSELVANVIKHVGVGTPSTLIASLNGPHLRVEVHDPDPRALPTLACTGMDAEEGRGMMLVDAISDRWGVELTGDRKVTWCEFRMSVAGADRQTPMPRLARAADVLGLYSGSNSMSRPVGSGRLATAVAEEAAIDIITDLLYWFRVHGRDADDVLDQAQAHFEAESAARLS
ncbi:ATP-binding protein [Streptomyces lancefieldiae]|uniref:ATP-binding protein n=1 Tax=Streptomyces lancefieldiae TaxID=3075520 RepID=A0ABU3AT66_9ACTN|nr:ATP-binding protein [Streptomyces sp. DSM 40712]MDT0613384.1 ATP-binding protein [Streptomyces sp. DSM 40712]